MLMYIIRMGNHFIAVKILPRRIKLRSKKWLLSFIVEIFIDSYFTKVVSYLTNCVFLIDVICDFVTSVQCFQLFLFAYSTASSANFLAKHDLIFNHYFVIFTAVLESSFFHLFTCFFFKFDLLFSGLFWTYYIANCYKNLVVLF